MTKSVLGRLSNSRFWSSRWAMMQTMPVPKGTLSKTGATAAMAKTFKAHGITVYDVTLGEPDFTAPAHIY